MIGEAILILLIAALWIAAISYWIMSIIRTARNRRQAEAWGFEPIIRQRTDDPKRLSDDWHP